MTRASYETLAPGDEERLDRFLATHTESSMFLRSNLRQAGLRDDGALYEGTYAAAIHEGAIESVASHYWNGVLVVQSPREEHLAPLVALAVRASERPIAGIAGPWAQVVAARAALGLGRRETARAAAETLYTLALDALVMPSRLTSGDVRCEVLTDRWLDDAVEHRVAYCVETLGNRDSEALRDASRKELVRLSASESTFVLFRGDAVEAVASFNARLPDCVQLGGVYTRPDRRCRGAARSVVAGALAIARAGGATRAVLFTEVENVPARRAYEALGFREAGSYGLCLFR